MKVPLFVCSSCMRRFECVRSLSTKAQNYRLIEVGKLEAIQPTGYYQAGQFFLHRVFGYRGVILFPWMARVYDRDICTSERSSSKSWEEDGVLYDQIKDIRPEKKPYYQALIDNRDIPYVRTHPEAITFLASTRDTSLYSLPGLDYVSHDDVIPYTSTNQDPFIHELFAQFLVPSGETKGPLYIPRDVLGLWREKNHDWLELNDVHCETTKGVKLTVMPFYMGWTEKQHKGKIHWWRYNVRIESLLGERLQLRERHWRIYSMSGTLETVKGKGVIGQEPIFTGSQPAFQYSSHVSLQSPTGHMWGTFRLDRADRSSFEVRIPPFTLDSHEDNTS